MATSSRRALEASVYRAVHRDYKLTKDGRKYVLILDKKDGMTKLCPLSELTVDELRGLLGATLTKS